MRRQGDITYELKGYLNWLNSEVQWLIQKKIKMYVWVIIIQDIFFTNETTDFENAFYKNCGINKTRRDSNFKSCKYKNFFSFKTTEKKYTFKH